MEKTTRGVSEVSPFVCFDSILEIEGSGLTIVGYSVCGMNYIQTDSVLMYCRG
jgi:hypothetical protein